MGGTNELSHRRMRHQLSRQLAEPSKIVPFVPASKASLSIAGATITRNAAHHLRLAASSPALEKHTMSKKVGRTGSSILLNGTPKPKPSVPWNTHIDSLLSSGLITCCLLDAT
jgi:hypothetical protein